GSGARAAAATVRRLGLAILAALTVFIAVVGQSADPPGPDQTRHSDYAVVVGVAGLRWSDIDPERTPTLWRLAAEGSVGSLSTRSARAPTCPADGWLTLGAGNFAAWERGDAPCGAATARLERPDRLGAHLPDQRAVVARNSASLPWGAVPGAL